MAPVRLIPRKNLRLLSGILPPPLSYFIIIIQSLQKFRGPHDGNQQILEVEPGIPELHEKLVDGFLVRGSFQAAIGIAEDLADDAFLAHWAGGQNTPQLSRI